MTRRGRPRAPVPVLDPGPIPYRDEHVTVNGPGRTPGGEMRPAEARARILSPGVGKLMTATRRRSYGEADYWRLYQALLPEGMRLGPGREPAEEWWAWRGAEIHLDRYAAPAAPLTVVLLHGAGGYGRLLAPFGLMLRRHGYEVVMPDLPGYGLSVAPKEMFSYRCWVDCAADLAEAEASGPAGPWPSSA